MAQVQHVIRAELNPAANPVQEICIVIDAMISYHKHQEVALLRGVAEAIEKRLKQIEKKGDANG